MSQKFAAVGSGENLGLRMGTQIPVKQGLPLSFAELYDRITSPTLQPSAALDMLSKYVPEIMRLFMIEPYRDDCSFALRCGESQRMPTIRPSAVQISHASAIASALSLNLADASLLLQDYLTMVYGKQNISDRFLSEDRFVPAIQVIEVKKFWLREKECAMLTLARMYLFTTSAFEERFRERLLPFVQAQHETIGPIVLKKVCDVIQGCTPTMDDAAVSELAYLDSIAGLFFAIVHSQKLGANDLRDLVKKFASAVRSTSQNRFTPHRQVSSLESRALLCTSRSCLYLCASLIAGMMNLWSNQTKHVASEELPTSECLDNGNSHTKHEISVLSAIDDALCTADESEFIELAILRLFWASSGSMQRLGSCKPSCVADVVHLHYAVRLNVFEVISALLTDLNHFDFNDALEGAMRCTLWDAMSLHLKRYSLTAYVRSTAERVSEITCAVAILDKAGYGPASSAAVNLWQNEYSEKTLWSGANSLLRSALLLFPLRLTPLISLLRVFCTDVDSSMEVVKTLNQKLSVRTESAETYMTQLHALSDDEVSLVREGAVEMEDKLLIKFFKFIYILAQHNRSDQIVLVQPAESLKSPYGDLLEARTGLGLLNSADSSVTWACRWNGWKAVELTLEYLKSFLRHPEPENWYDDSSVTDLINCSVQSLDLLCKLFQTGTEETREHLVQAAVPPELVCDIFHAASNPSAAVEVLLSSERRCAILKCAGFCLRAMTQHSSQQSKSVLDRLLFSQSSRTCFQAVLSTLGLSAYPAVASVALVLVSAVCLDNFEKPAWSIFRSSACPETSLEQLQRLTISDINDLIPLSAWLSQHGTSSPSSNDDAAYWLLPAVAMEVLMLCPHSSLDAPLVSGCIFSVLTSVTHEMNDEKQLSPCYYFAVRNALALCHEVLLKRNAELDEAIAGAKNCDQVQAQRCSSAFEDILMNSEVINALAVLSAGTSLTALKAALFRQQRNVSIARLFADRDGPAERTTAVETLAAQSLALYVTCLAKGAQLNGGRARQIPWPYQFSSQTNTRFGDGRKIRNGLARKIEHDEYPFVIDMVSTLVSCGQRAVARGMLAPDTVLSYRDNGKDSSSDTRYSQNEILSAVVEKLSRCLSAWTKGSKTPLVSPENSSSVVLVINIEACVRFLRVIWECHGAVWLKNAWISLRVWDILGSILRCDVSPSVDNSFNVAPALMQVASISNTMEKNVDLQLFLDRLREPGLLIDASSVWRGIVADVLDVFTSEIVVRAGDLMKFSKSEVSLGSDAGTASKRDRSNHDLAQFVFEDPAFISLRDSFTEHWMLVFLDLRHLDVSCQNSSIASQHRESAISIEELSGQISRELSRICRRDRGESVPDTLLLHFRRKGQIRSTYGSNYVFSINEIFCELRRLQVAPKDMSWLLHEIAVLNSKWSRVDSQLCLMKSFSRLTMMVVMADTVAPSPGMSLTYASPQYCGKLCRVIAHAITSSCLQSIASSSSTNIHFELVRLLGFASARLSSEEMDQSALSAVRVPVPFLANSKATPSGPSPVSGIASVISRYAHSSQSADQSESGNRLAVVRWLLLSGSRLAPGPAFRSTGDLKIFARAAINSMHTFSAEPKVCSAASAALASMVTAQDGDDGALQLNTEDWKIMFNTVANLCACGAENADEYILAAASVLLFLVKLVAVTAPSEQTVRFSLRTLAHLSSGCIAALLPSGVSTIPAYKAGSLERQPIHRLWCAFLALASSLLNQDLTGATLSAEYMSCPDGVTEFARSNFKQLASLSLEIAGHWTRAKSSVGNRPNLTRGYLTLAQIEETELAMSTIFALAKQSVDLRQEAPHAVNAFCQVTLRIAYQTYRLIRAEPIERWVRPVSRQEKEQSGIFQVGKDLNSSSGGQPSTPTGSPWAQSPGSSPGGTTISSSSSKKTPQQALRSVLSGLSTRDISSVNVPPSPGMPSTPQYQSPMSVVVTPRSTMMVPKYQPPSSPWDLRALGLIRAGGLAFGDEVAVSILRTLSAALGSLRRFCVCLDIPLFAATMTISEQSPSIGLLVGIQFHACSEIQRGAEGERRKTLSAIIENAFHLSMIHAAYYSKKGELSAGLRDEIHKRLETVISRMRRAVPLPQNDSVMNSVEIDNFLSHFKGT